MGLLWKILTRKKVIEHVEETQLARRLNTFDLTALGVGSTLGVGVYVLVGHVAKNVAGPSVVLSFLIAAVASLFAGLCYAEFGARAPRAGSAYIYSYVCVGEFIAFIIGWNLILEYIIGSASVAKGLSLYLDTLINNTLQNTFRDIAPMNIPFMAQYFDFFSFGISVLLAIALAFGLKESSLANNIFTILNIAVVLFVVVAGSLKADAANWHYHPDNSTNSTVVGTGGFFPFGIEGTIAGAAKCFYGFVGFDCIATTGEEVRNPKKAIPISIVLSLLIIFLAYFGISTVVTMMVPYYLQNTDAPIPYAFDHIGWHWAKWVVSIGGIFGLCASLFGAMFPLPRIIYAMANDSLVFKFLGKVHSRFQTPVIGTLLAGTLTGLMAALFDLNQLVNMMSIGTLMAYTIVAASVLILRYTDEVTTFDVNEDSLNDDSISPLYTNTSVVRQIFNCGRSSEPTAISQSIVATEVFLYCVTCVLIALSAIYMKHSLGNGDIWAIVITAVVVFLATMLLMSMATQPVSKKELSFKVPLVPLIPAVSILANIYLMLMLDYWTWIRFAVWMVIGLPIYYYSHKTIEDDEDKTKPEETKLNNNINYFYNNGFMDDNDHNHKPKSIKKMAPAPPQKTEDKAEVIQVIEQFDEMLEEVSNTLERNKNSKTSISSVSLSGVSSREESVVADVHCDNVASPAISINDTDFFYEIIDPAELQTNTQQEPSEDFIKTDVPDENKLVIVRDYNLQKNPISFISVSESSPAYTEAVSFNIPPVSTSTSIIDFSSNNSASVEDELPVSLLTSSDPSAPSTVDLSPIHSPNIEEAPLPPPLPNDVLETSSGDNTKKSSAAKDDKSHTLPRVSSTKLKEVTLRPTKKREEVIKDNFVPDDDNLKIGSDNHKTFKENLNSLLKRSMFVPNYIKPKKGLAPQPPKKPEKNVNVIEEHIDRNSAREKLGLYVENRISNVPTKEIVNKTDEDEEKIEETVNNELIVGETLNSITLNKENDESNSIQQNDDILRESAPRRRYSSTLDQRGDETKYRQAMSDVFRSIQLRGKISSQQHTE